MEWEKNNTIVVKGFEVKAMKYSVGIILLIIVFFISLFNKNEFTIYFNILLLILFYLVLFLMEYSVFDKTYDSDFKIQSQRKILSKRYYLFVFGYTIFIVLVDFQTSTKILFILFIWTSLILEIIMYHLYKKKKPFTIFIKKNELIIANKGVHKRDVSGLNRVLFDRISKAFELRFDRGYKLNISTRNYKKEDIDKLLEIIIEKSEHPVFIPKNYLEEKRK